MGLEKPPFDTILFEEGGFSIRVGNKRHFIMHNQCASEDNLSPRAGIAHNTGWNGDVIHSGSCRDCGEKYSEAMAGFIALLNWEK